MSYRAFTLIVIAAFLVSCSTEPPPKPVSTSGAEPAAYQETRSRGGDDLEFEEEVSQPTETKDRGLELETEESSGEDTEEGAQLVEPVDDIIVIGGEYGDGTTHSKGDVDLTVKMLHREDRDLRIHVSGPGGEQVVIAPNERASATAKAMCQNGQETELEIKVSVDTLVKAGVNTRYLGILHTTDTSVKLGVEVDGSCGGPGCEDDNIFEVSCPDGIKVI